MKSNYKHGVESRRVPTQISVPVKADGCLQCVVGTAPVNLAENPYNAVNRPFSFYTKSAAVAALGYSTDFENYTLCQSMYASFDVFGVAPVVMINVLDPRKHVKAQLSKEYVVEAGKIRIEETGILLDKLSISSLGESETVYRAEEDYMATFNTDGTVTVVVVNTGAAAGETRLKASFVQIDPSAVTYEDVIGSYDVATRQKSGMELIDQVYPKLGLVPSLLLAPGWSHKPAVALALAAKPQSIFSLFTAKVAVDLDTAEGKADSMEEIREYKDNNGYSDRNMIACWPMVRTDDYQYYYSAQLGAHLARLSADNGGVPSKSPSNKDIKITGLCTADGREVVMDIDEANDYANACGVVTAINFNGWKCWGNNTAAYPSSSDPIDRWINTVTIFDYMENNFKLTFFQKVDELASYRLVDMIVSGFNMQLNSLQASGDIAGGQIVFEHDENPIDEILGGHILFHTYVGGWAPAEHIENVFEFDPTITEDALKGGGE